MQEYKNRTYDNINYGKGSSMFFTRNRSKRREFKFKQECITIFLSTIALFLACALLSYNPEDPTLLYRTLNPQPITNWCGFMGAHIAALFIYIWGGSSLLCVPFFLFLAYLAYSNTWHYEWDRIVAFVVLLAVSALFCAIHHVDFIANVFSGGLVGYELQQLLCRYIDTVGCALVTYALLILSITVLSRFSFIYFIQIIVQKCYSLLLMLWRFTFVHKIQMILYSIKSMVTYISKQTYSFVLRLLSGSYFITHERSSTEGCETQCDPAGRDQSNLFSNPTETTFPKSHTQEYRATSVVTSFDTNQNQQGTHYELPTLLATSVPDSKNDTWQHEAETRAQLIEEKLKRFGIVGKITAIKHGPVVTLFEYHPHSDIKLSRILAFEDDIAMTLQTVSVRIIAPIPGKSVVGFEVANQQRNDVLLSQLIQSHDFHSSQAQLPLILGEDTSGMIVIEDLARMPHLLLAGSTGSGKSVALNTMLMSLLCKLSPEALRLVLIDPKRLELASYVDIPHLLFPVVTDVKRALPIFRWLIHEMERRYIIMAEKNVRHIAEYNAYVPHHEQLPFIIIVVDEFADLMMTVGRDIENYMVRITQMARAAGMHMIIATQRPSVDVITGLIKVNFPTRISFRVASKIDSRTILDCTGAEKLLGKGDMLMLDTSGILRRIHGAYVTAQEIKQVVMHSRMQKNVSYVDTSVLQEHEEELAEEDEQLYQQIVTFLQEVDEVSISLLQRRFRIGYNRSARIIEKLESHGLIMTTEGGKTRKVIR